MVINENIEDTNTILPRRAMGATIYLAYEYVERKMPMDSVVAKKSCKPQDGTPSTRLNSFKEP